MTTKQSTKKGGAKGKGRGGKGKAKASRLSATDLLTAERIRAILSDPKAKRGVKSKLEELTYELYAQTNAFSEVTPDSRAADFINGTAALLVTPYEDARAIHDEIVRLAEAGEPEEYKVARRVRELFAATSDAAGCTLGGRLVMEAADDVTMSGGERVMLSSPLSEFFVPFFVKAVRELGRDYHSYQKLKTIIVRVDAGEDLDVMGEAQYGGRE